jgi:SAM-dependent methyltransferase
VSEQGSPDLSVEQAAVYEALFVPAMFAPWAPVVAEAAELRAGDRVLDVACGTGVLARAAAAAVGPAGTVVGLDPNDGMLAVASRTAPQIEWRRGVAEALPFDAASFDAVVSQFGLMFFRDRHAAIGEMRRVLRPGGRLAVAVWGALDDAPAYVAFVGLLQELFGTAVADRLRAPFALGDAAALSASFAAAGLSPAGVAGRDGTVRFPSLRVWVEADAKGWLQLDDDQHRTLLAAADTALRPFVAADGRVAFSLPAYLVTARRG